MRRIARTTGALAALAVLGVFAAAPTAWAQESGDHSERRGRGPGEVSLDVVDRPLKDVIEYIQDKTETNLVLSEAAEQVLVNVKVKNLPWREALEVVVERAGCQLDEKSANLIRIEKPPRVKFEFDNADIREVIKAVAATAGANIVIGREVEGTVTLSLHDVPWRVALDTIVKTLGYTVVQEDRGILRIVSPASIRTELETRVFRLKFVRPSSPYRAKIETQISESSVSAIGDSIADIEANFNLLKAFTAAVGGDGSVTYIRETNSLIATSTAPALDELERLISRVDVEPAQVYVDVKFITTSNDDFLDLGVGPGDSGLSASAGLGSMVHRFPFHLGDGGFEDNLTPGRNADGRRGLPLPIGPGDPLFNSLFQFGTLDFSATQFAMNLVKTDSKSRIVQAPKLIALDNQEATIFVGETIRFAQTTASSSQSGTLEFSIAEAANSPVQVGFQLLMIPHVIPDRNQIMMTIIPQERALTGTSAEQPGFDVFRTADDQAIALPRERNATVVTHVKLDDGQTAVIGGLLRDEQSEETSQIPFLGDIPVLGYLFKSESSRKVKNNLIVFITPKIIRDTVQMREVVLDELRDREDRIEAELMEIYGDGNVQAGGVDLPPARPGLSGPK